jgi:hypothetical protein
MVRIAEAAATMYALPSRAWHRLVFLNLAVMTEAYALYRHDVMFLQEHCDSSSEA